MRWRWAQGRLFRKYVVLFGALVSGALLTSGLTDMYFTYRETTTALLSVQREKAAAAAVRIDQFIKDIERQVRLATSPGLTVGPEALEQRRLDYYRLQRQARAITEVSWIDPAGKEQLRLSQLAMEVVGSGEDLSQDPKFLAAKSGSRYFSPVYFRKESEPYITIGMLGSDRGVTLVEVNLKFIWDVISEIKVGRAGRAYVVDSLGHLIAHPDISLVLKKTDLSSLSQVRAARDERGGAGQTPRDSAIARDVDGGQVLTAHAAIAPLGWLVFVDLPVQEAFAPLYASLLRTATLMLLGVILSVAVSMILARTMVRPIHALATSAAQIGAGTLDHRIALQTGDELEALADEFNRMAARLQDSYADLERKVEERTQALEKANRHKSEFLANMSHELRTPLNAIIGFSEALTERMFGDLNEKQDEYLRDIHASGQHLLSLINDILDLAKVEAGRMELEPSDFDLPQAIDSAVMLVRERATRRGIAIGRAVDGRLGHIRGDERKIRQVMLNLLSNAIKFTPEGGRIEVRAVPGEGCAEVSVSDTGVGIAPEDQDAVFEEFRQVGPGAAKQEGTGLGLALSRRFIELHGGTIWVKSQVGVGSTFTFTIPVQDNEIE